MAAVELLTPGRAAALMGTAGPGAVLFAGLACAGCLCSTLGSQLAPLAARSARSSERAVPAGGGVVALGLALLAVTTGSMSPFATAAAVSGYGLVYLGF